MKTAFLYASSALTLIMGINSAMAADVYPPQLPNDYTVTSYDWNGFYGGLHVGAAWLDTWDSQVGAIEDTPSAIVGAHGGFAAQFGNFVLGLEADFSLTAFERDSNGTTTADLDAPWHMTGRTRIGYAFDRVHLYATGGLTYAKASLTTASGANTTTLYRVGHVLGAGIEYGLDENWSFGAEYLHHDYWEDDVTLATTFPATANIDELRARISYRF